VPVEEEFCPNCGAELRTGVIRIESLEGPPQIVDRYSCPECGSHYTPEDLHLASRHTFERQRKADR
jgi:transposase-like protein